MTYEALTRNIMEGEQAHLTATVPGFGEPNPSTLVTFTSFPVIHRIQ